MSEKDYIISLLDKYLKYLEENENKNRSYFKDVLSQINDNYNYIYDFIIGISENLILELLDDIHYENKKDFLLDFNEIRNKLLSYNGDYSNLKLDDGENNTINLFKKLINDFVNVKDDDKDYVLDFKDRLDNNKSLLENDYDLLEKIIYLFEKDDADVLFEEAMDYLNRYNISLIRKYSKKEKKKVVYKKVGDNNSINVTPFENMVSFDYVPKEKTRVNKKRKVEDKSELKREETKDIKKLFNDYGFDYENVCRIYADGIKSFNFDETKGFLEYLNDNSILKDVDKNGKILGLLLTKSNLNKFRDVNDILRNKYSLNDKSIEQILKRYTLVYCDDEINNFTNNVQLLNLCGIKDINVVISDNIMFLLNSYNDNLNVYNKLNDMGIDANNLFKNALNVVSINNELLFKNIDVLCSYGFDLRDEEDYKSFSVLLINDLARTLDMFIEMGYSEFIHDKPELTLRNIKSLIIKRILFAYKNNLNIWDNVKDDSPNKINYEYEKFIKNRNVLNDSEINLLIKEHPILSLLDSGMRITTFNESYFASIKRKTELVFNNKIVSRIKTYSVFKALIDNKVKEENALLYALTYNMDLNEYEYDMLKKVVYRGKVE